MFNKLHHMIMQLLHIQLQRSLLATVQRFPPSCFHFIKQIHNAVEVWNVFLFKGSVAFDFCLLQNVTLLPCRYCCWQEMKQSAVMRKFSLTLCW